MVKKILAIFTIAILTFSCSKLEIREKKPQDTEFTRYYNSWEIQKMENLIQKHILMDGYTREIPRYQSMLEDRKRAKEELENIVSHIREEILQNNLTTMESYMSSGLRNAATMRELKKIDFTGFRIYTSKLKYNKSYASNIVALNLGEETFYFDVNYEYEKKKWKIVDFKERR